MAPKCEACIARKIFKATITVLKEKQIRSKQPLERIHIDLIGPFSKQWLGKKYPFTIMDEYSRYCTAIPIYTKSDIKEKVKE